MNRLSSKMRLLGGGLAASVIICSSFAAVAAETATARGDATRGSSFCTNLPATISRVNSSLSNLQEKLSSAWSERDQKMADNYSKWDQALANDRANWATKRQDAFSKLQAKATTDAQKAAVQAFINTVTAAIQTRENANDQARASFRAGVSSLVSSQRSNIGSQKTAFVSAVDAAEANAQSACASNPSQGAAARTAFIAALKAAREAYTADRKGDSGIGDQVKQLAASRNAAIKANDTAFKNTMQQAAQTLKAAFTGSSTNISD